MVKRSASVPIGRDAVPGIPCAWPCAIFRPVSGFIRPVVRLATSGVEVDAVDQVDRVERIALGLGHLLALRSRAPGRARTRA